MASTIFAWMVFGWLWALPRYYEWKQENTPVDNNIREMVFEDGTVYSGTIHNDLPDGVGNATQVDGTVYSGQWRYGLRDGFGTETYAESGDVYIGEWNYDEWEGEGILLFGATGNRYAGQFQRGAPNGFGQYNTVDGIIYTGHLRNSMYDGQGHLT